MTPPRKQNLLITAADTMAVTPAGLLYLICLCGTVDATVRAKCDPIKCRPEDNCLCLSTQPPGNLSGVSMPQFVMLTFDDAVNEQNMDFYRQLLAPGRRRNRASGCNMAATFFVSAGYTDYTFVHELHSAGNEIALHSITHRNNLSYWKTLDAAGWEAEFIGERHILRDYALIPEQDMVGARAPFLEAGSGGSYLMMRKHGLLYDSSVAVNYSERPDRLPVYPYTLDYGLQTECENKPCPEGTYKGLWMVPLNRFYRKVQEETGLRVHSDCNMADICLPQPATPADMFDFLRSNFESYYHYNRAPFSFFIHQKWLRQQERAQGFLSFVDWLLTKDDVFLVTVTEVVRFMHNPKPLGEYAQSKCSKVAEFTRCPEIDSCHFPEATVEEARWLTSCRRCPESYPWLLEEARKETRRDRAVRPVAPEELYYRTGCIFLFGSVLVFCLFVFSKRFTLLFSSRHSSSSHSKVSVD